MGRKPQKTRGSGGPGGSAETKCSEQIRLFRLAAGFDKAVAYETRIKTMQSVATQRIPSVGAPSLAARAAGSRRHASVAAQVAIARPIAVVPQMR